MINIRKSGVVEEVEGFLGWEGGGREAKEECGVCLLT